MAGGKKNNIEELMELHKTLSSFLDDAPEATKDQMRAEIREAFETASVDDESYRFSPIGGEDTDEDRIPLWLITFTDIMALMLTFFVLLYSMSVPDELQWNEMILATEQGITQTTTRDQFAGTMQAFSVDRIDTHRALDLGYLQRIVQERFSEQLSAGHALMMRGDDRLVLAMPSDVVFDVGKAELSLEGKKILFGLSELFRMIPNRIEIVGHSDPTPISNAQYDSNWHLSLMRALSVANVLKQSGYRKDVVVRGVAGARYESVSDEFSAELRQKLARRVDIVIDPDTGKQKFFAPSLAR